MPPDTRLKAVLSDQIRLLAAGFALGAVLLVAWFIAWDPFGSWLAGAAHWSSGAIYLARGGGAALLASAYATFITRRSMRRYAHVLEAAVERRTEQLVVAMNQAAAQERRFKEVIERASDGFVLIDPRGNISCVNGATERLFDCRRDEVIGYPFTVLSRHGECAEVVAACVRGESPPKPLGQVYEFEGTRKDGSHFAADCILGAPRVDEEVAYAAVIRDTSERRRAEEERRRNEEMFRGLIEQSPDGIVVVSKDDLGIVYVNPAAILFLGYGTAAELLGRPAEVIIQQDERAEMKANSARIQETGRGMPPVERRFLRKDSGEAVAEVVSIPIEFKGQPSIMAILRDLTERKRLEGRLLVADRMASVGTLAAGVAHEINNPLASVMANLSLAASEVAAQAERLGLSAEFGEVRDELHDACESADRIRNIVRDLKLFSRSEEEEKGAVDVRRVMESTLRMAWNEIRHRARLVKNYGETPMVEASDSRLGQVFLNLVVNAAQAIKEGNAEKNEIRVSTGTDGPGRVVIEIADTGPGIPAEVLGRLFTPFFTTKPVGVGTGLGLSICHRIVTGFGGSIDVKSEVGKGTVFRVSLLAASPELPDEKRPVVVRVSTARRRGTILVVDDEPLIGKAVQRSLSPEHEVVTLTKAEEALKRISAGEEFDVILCDLMMPQMTGMEFHAELLRVAGDHAQRMVFLTGGAFTQAARAFLDQVPNLRIEKPFDPQNLRALINDRIR